ncbi:MAG: MerR family transcriptional regulator [Bryobacterales bacterium]|nr:MerR family transcriptional regulator [Bryobacterales bacterium]
MSQRSEQKPATAIPPRFLTVGETARILGISPSTLRLWENVGLISPARSSGRYRLYNHELLSVLKRIKYLRDVKKLSVPSIRKELNGPEPARVEIPGNNRVIGSKLRNMRKILNLGVVEAAGRAGISPGFLSAIESSKANPSVATLHRLAAAYNTTVLEFFDLPNRPQRVVRPGEARVLRTESGVDIELLSLGTKMLEPMLFRIPPSTGSDGAYSHAGEEFIYMLRGTLEIWLGETECYRLQAGDSFWFESNVGHRWFNPSEQDAVLIWINTPMTF